MGKVSISVDTSQVTKELHRLLGAPDMKTVLAFNSLFAEVAAEVDAIIHVETGSLKSTARWDSPTVPLGWQGALHVGGAAPGAVNDPAYYGVYELARGGTHFFFAPAYADIPPKMIDIILAFYSGGDAKMAISAVTPSGGGAGKAALKTAAGQAKASSKAAGYKAKAAAKKGALGSRGKISQKKLEAIGYEEAVKQGILTEADVHQDLIDVGALYEPKTKVSGRGAASTAKIGKRSGKTPSRTTKSTRKSFYLGGGL